MKKNFWKGKRILITGHTGFKGSWLSIWMKILGAKVFGISLPPASGKNIFKISNLKNKIDKNIYLDIKDKDKLKKEIIKLKPEIIFHLAAQSLVIESFKNPINTIETNILGTANLLEISKEIKSLKTIIIVTTDKVYSNKNKKNFFNEKDELGGDDIYSYSKVCVEMLVDSYKKLFFKNKKNIITVRAGNVIGGGDWSKNRLIPDFIRSYENNLKFFVRNPKHVRPWQHIIDCLYGYILIAEKISKKRFQNLSTLNFGPNNDDVSSVNKVVKIILKKLQLRKKIILMNKKTTYQEKFFLALNSKLAKKSINWSSKISLDESVNLTLNWYINFFKKKDMYDYTCKQIKNYIVSLR